MPRYLFKKDRQLADQSLLTADPGLAALTVCRRPGSNDIRPRRRFAAQHLAQRGLPRQLVEGFEDGQVWFRAREAFGTTSGPDPRSEEHTSELQSRRDLVCRLLLEK